jgi:hypothetical protein
MRLARAVTDAGVLIIQQHICRGGKEEKRQNKRRSRSPLRSLVSTTAARVDPSLSFSLRGWKMATGDPQDGFAMPCTVKGRALKIFGPFRDGFNRLVEVKQDP